MTSTLLTTHLFLLLILNQGRSTTNHQKRRAVLTCADATDHLIGHGSWGQTEWTEKGEGVFFSQIKLKCWSFVLESLRVKKKLNHPKNNQNVLNMFQPPIWNETGASPTINPLPHRLLNLLARRENAHPFRFKKRPPRWVFRSDRLLENDV